MWAARTSLLNAILGLDKQESFARTKSRQRERYPWITLSHLVPPQIWKDLFPWGNHAQDIPFLGVCAREHHACGVPSLGHTVHAAGLGCSGLAPPSSLQPWDSISPNWE